MRVKFFFAAIFILAAGLVLIQNAVSEEKKMSQEEMMAIYMKYANPGEGHKILDACVGSWDFVSKWWESPSSPAQESKGTSESKWILGGRYVQEDVTGDMMGQPFHGMGLTGFDTYKQQYISFWFDEMSTTGMSSTGKADATGKIITFNGTWDDCITGKTKTYKTVTLINSNDQHVMEMYEVGEDGKEFKNMEIVYTRKKM